MPTVKTFDEDAIIEDLKKSGKYDAVELIKAYKRSMENQQRITAKAVKKIKELSKWFGLEISHRHSYFL